MGRGVSWCAQECSDLARAWIAASEDPIIGIDHTSLHFNRAMFEKFSAMATQGMSDKKYGERGLRPVRSKWDQISADCQKFRRALRFIKACNPTGVTEDQVISMAIAKHLGKRDTMAYDVRDFPHERWNNHLAYRVLHRVPKFKEDQSVALSGAPFRDIGGEIAIDSSQTENNTKMGHTLLREEVRDEASDANLSTPNESNGISDLENEDNVDVYNDSCVDNATELTVESPTPNQGGNSSATYGGEMESPSLSRSGSSCGGHKGWKKAKAEFQKQKYSEMSLKNVQIIADSMRRRVELIEEKNAMVAFTMADCTTATDKADRRILSSHSFSIPHTFS